MHAFDGRTDRQTDVDSNDFCKCDCTVYIHHTTANCLLTEEVFLCSYTWLKLPDHEQQRCIETGEPYFSPTLVGCAIAVYKDYFMDIGAFDEGLRVWGGENLELAFRVWMCGGKVSVAE